MSPLLVRLSLDAPHPPTPPLLGHIASTLEALSGGGLCGLTFLTQPHGGLLLRWGFVLGALGRWEGCELVVWALAACGWWGIPGKLKSPVCRWPA